MTPQYRYAIVVIPAVQQADMNQAALQWDPTGGEETFTVPLSADGAEPASYYWCGTWMTQATWDAILAQFSAVENPSGSARYANTSGSKLYDGATWTPEQVLTDVGLQRVELAL
ncbi:MAG: hypothetical protein NUW01_14175 [Gemmatimonadaceae bacterium]|nr:hypothetical protein [Gemmatimonadaceae bacterium]